jgi:hypothetical protein
MLFLVLSGFCKTRDERRSHNLRRFYSAADWFGFTVEAAFKKLFNIQL